MRNETRWLKTPLLEFGEIKPIELDYQPKTPEGRSATNKRMASPLTGQEKKLKEGSDSQTEEEEDN